MNMEFKQCSELLRPHCSNSFNKSFKQKKAFPKLRQDI